MTTTSIVRVPQTPEASAVLAKVAALESRMNAVIPDLTTRIAAVDSRADAIVSGSSILAARTQALESRATVAADVAAADVANLTKVRTRVAELEVDPTASEARAAVAALTVRVTAAEALEIRIAALESVKVLVKPAWFLRLTNWIETF
jgi:hypothetical protein